MFAKIKRCLLLSKESLKKQCMLDRLRRAVLKIVTEKYIELSREMYIFAENENIPRKYERNFTTLENRVVV